MTPSFDLKIVQAEWVLRLIHTDDLPSIAIQALSSRIESKSLVQLAGLSREELPEARDLFERSLGELGCKDMSKTDALKYYAKKVSTLILETKITPLEGARRIWQATLKSGSNEFHDLDGFIYAASEIEDRPKDKSLFEKGIIEEARCWIDFE